MFTGQRINTTCNRCLSHSLALLVANDQIQNNVIYCSQFVEESECTSSPVSHRAEHSMSRSVVTCDKPRYPRLHEHRSTRFVRVSNLSTARTSRCRDE